MAYSLHPIPNFFPPSSKPRTITKSSNPIRCGPRDNRGPLVKGRILSTEAIQAIQSVKRSHKSNPSLIPKTLARLIKSDLLAALRELLRQNQCAVALHALAAVRSEYGLELSLYADVISALARNGEAEEIDRLVAEMEEEGGVRWDDRKGAARLIRAVVAAERRESTVRIYRMMKERSVWGDEYVVRVLSKGLRRFGEGELAGEVEREFGGFSKGNLEKLRV